MKGFIIAGTKSGIGKTTITLGLMKNFQNVSPFKIGPDYIDGRFHEYATKNPSYNLDYFLMKEEGIKYSFLKHRKDISIIEGVMGLYDGLGDEFSNGSTAHISKILNLPIILVVDGEKRGTSISAEVLGYKNFDSEINICGVIINRVTSKKAYDILASSIEKYTGITCLGYLPKIQEVELGERHLGLIQAGEDEKLEEKLEILASKVKETINLDKILELTEIQTKENEIVDKLISGTIINTNKVINLKSKIISLDKKNKYQGVTIGIAKDSAFSFYYNDNIEFLKGLGVEIRYFSPINDKTIPTDVDILYFGGGYPENYGETLSKNQSMIESIRDFYNKNGVIYGECGGYIYLSKSLTTLDGKIHNFVGITDRSFVIKNRLNIKRFGYIDVNFKEFSYPAHEFHYSEVIGGREGVFKISKKDGRSWECGYEDKNLLCGYPHIHFFTSKDLIFDLLDRALAYREKKNRFSFMDFFNFGNFRKGKE